MPLSDARAAGEDQVRGALEQDLSRVDLDLEPVAPGENRMIGIALAPAAHSTVEVDQSHMPAALHTEDDAAAIRSTLTGWSSMHPDEMEHGWKRYCTEPYYHVSGAGVKPVDGKTVSSWLASDDFRALKERFGYHATRKVTISDVHITHLGGHVACATYRHREEGTKGKPVVGNGAVLLHKVPGSAGAAPHWKIAVVSRHDAFEGA